MELQYLASRMNSYTLCRLPNQKKTNLRFAVTQSVLCSDSVFNNIVSILPGGCIYVSNLKTTLEVTNCAFDQISTSGFEKFEHRDASGGAILANIFNCTISNTVFIECYGVKKEGTSCAIFGEYGFLSTISESAFSKYSGEAFETDCIDADIKKINFSYPIDEALSIVIGSYPENFCVKRISVVGEKNIAGIDYSCQTNDTLVSSLLFIGFNAVDGIASIWKMSLTLSDVHVIKCNGFLVTNHHNARAHFKASWVGSVLINDTFVTLDSDVVKEDSPVDVTPIIQFNIKNICSRKSSFLSPLCIAIKSVTNLECIYN